MKTNLGATGEEAVVLVLGEGLGVLPLGLIGTLVGLARLVGEAELLSERLAGGGDLSGQVFGVGLGLVLFLDGSGC